jgi:hypothetical protein
MSLPDLPKFPKWSKRITSSNLDGSIPKLSSSLMARESSEIVSLIDDRNRGVLLHVTSDSPLARYHGCRSCPFYGSSFCFG